LAVSQINLGDESKAQARKVGLNNQPNTNQPHKPAQTRPFGVNDVN